MARPERNDIDYFPHEVTHGKKMFIIENKYKNDGYAVWFKLLEELGKANFHYLDFNDEEQLMYLSSKFNIEEELLKNIVEDLAKLNAINKELYLENKIVFSEKFIESIQDAYKRRNNKCITLGGLCKHLLIKCKLNVDINLINADNKPQTKVDYNKLNENKENIKENILNNISWIESIAMKKRIDIDKVKLYLGTFLDDLELKDDLDKSEKEVKQHFVNWLNGETKKEAPKADKPFKYQF